MNTAKSIKCLALPKEMDQKKKKKFRNQQIQITILRKHKTDLTKRSNKDIQ